MANLAFREFKSDTFFLYLIAFYKLMKGFLLVFIGYDLFVLTSDKFTEMFKHLLDLINISPSNEYANWLLLKIALIDDTLLKEISLVILLYAFVSLIEGTGLFLRKSWAEFLSILVTGSPIPFEFYEIYKAITWGKLIITGLNILIVRFLVKKQMTRKYLKSNSMRS